MPANSIILTVYGILLIGGGIMGFLKAKSQMSLIMGILSGVIVLYGVSLIGNNPALGYKIIGITALLLIVVFLKRYLKTKKVMPAVPLMVLSVIAGIISILQII